MSSTRKIAFSSVIIALYIVMMYFTSSFAFAQYQVRIATSLYALGAVYPFLIVPLGLANMLSNMLLGGLGVFDILGGFIVGTVTTAASYLVSRFNLNDVFVGVALVLGPGLIVPIWLSKILRVPYIVLVTSLCIGQIIPAIVGVIIVKQLKKRLSKNINGRF